MVSDAHSLMTCLRYWAGACVLLCWMPAAFAVDALSLHMDRLEGQDWTLNGLDLNLDAKEGGATDVTATVHVLQHADQAFRELRLRCAAVQSDDNGVLLCSDGQLEIADSPLGAIAGRMSWRYADSTHWKLTLDDIRFSRSSLQLEARTEDHGLKLRFKLNNFTLSLLKAYVPVAWVIDGKASLQGDLLMESGVLTSARGTLHLKDFSYSSEDGLQVGEGLSAHLDFDVSRRAGLWQGKLGLRLLQGQLYADPFFVEIEKRQPAQLSLQGHLDATAEHLNIQTLAFDYGKLFSAQGDLDVDLSAPRIRQSNLSFHAEDLAQTYAVLMQPLVIGSALDDMSVSGQAQGRLQLSDGGLQSFSLVLREVHVEQNMGLFGLSGVEGEVYWRRSGVQQNSRLLWGSGHLFTIAFGKLDAAFSAHGGDVAVQPLLLPVLDGQLQLQDLRMGGLLNGNLNWQARAALRDIQLGTLSRSLGWPMLNGSLQASIPRLQYQNALLHMDGALLVDVFGGKVVVEGLKLQDPLGVAPVLETSVRLEALDLEQITQVFDLGRIQGSLEGYVRNLQLVGWRVTAFDASLQSPAKDRRRHRISQRAIDNLTELGNGASVNLSATMLRFFEDFAYDRLALKVKLRGAVAELDGVPNPKGGYYIVKGARLPRIDVIGRNHKVAWKDLLSRIRGVRFDDMIVE